MSMSISLRRGAQGTSETQGAESAAPATGAQSTPTQQAVRPRGGERGPDVIVGGGRSEQARRLEQASGQSRAATCVTQHSDAQLAAQYRMMINAGVTPRIPEAPMLPRGNGAALMRELNVPAPRLPAAYQYALDHHGDVHSPVMGAIVNAFAGGHASDQTHAVADIGTHAVVGAVEYGAHALHASVAAGAATAASLLLTADATVGRALMLAYQVHNNTTPTPESVRAFLLERAPQVLAQLRTRVEQQLEQQFNTGARAAASQQPLPADASPAFRRGYEEGQRYRAQHGCAFDANAQALRVLNQVTRGTERDASVGVRPLSARPERVAAEINLDE
jgi:hypothetical protein